MADWWGGGEEVCGLYPNLVLVLAMPDRVHWSESPPAFDKDLKALLPQRSALWLHRSGMHISVEIGCVTCVTSHSLPEGPARRVETGCESHSSCGCLRPSESPVARDPSPPFANCVADSNSCLRFPAFSSTVLK